MDKQQAFDKAARGIIAQGKQARNNNPADRYCMYRAPDGCMCAVGQLLPDGLPDKVYSFIGSARGLMNRFPEVREAVGVESVSDLHFLAELQNAHDTWDGPWSGEDFLTTYRRMMRKIAEDYGLNPAVLDEAA